MLRGLLLFILAGSVSAEAATTLEDSYQAALKTSETLASQERLIGEAETRYSQARGSILPNLAANASYTIQARPSDPLAEAFFPRTQPELKLTLKQPVFRGLREFAALRQYKSLSQAEKHAKDYASLLLFSDVAQSYHAVLAAEENLRNVRDQLKLYDERIGELRERVRAGTSSETDLLSLRASRGTVQSQLETAQASVNSVRETFAFLTGLSRTTELVTPSRERLRPKPIEEYLRTVESRPDILGSVERTQAASEQVGIAKGAYLPTVDLQGNYYFKRPSEIYEGIDWDVQLTASLPLYTGGVTSAQVRESALRRERAELELTRLRRQAEQQVRTLYRNYLAELDAVAALEDSLTLAEKNYRLLRGEFRRGLARNLDVLQALIASYEARRELVRARYISRDTWVQLHVAAGRQVSP